MTIFGCNKIDREMIRLSKFSEEAIEIKLVLSGTISDFGVSQQPIRFIIVGSNVVGFGRKSSKDYAAPEFENS
jgi:hypothetical protein